MRQAGTFESEQHANRICDYLLTQGIGTEVERDDGEWVLWVYDEDELDLVLRELAAFRKNPEAPKYQGHETEAQSIRQQIHKENVEAQRNYIDVRKRWSGTFRRIRPGNVPFSMALIAISIVVFIAMEVARPWVFRWLLISPVNLRTGTHVGLHAVASGQVWRLVTPIFIHFGIIHILFNCLWMYQLGGAIEVRKGLRVLVPLVLVSAVLSNLAEYLVYHHVLFGGLSGVVYALFGYVWMMSRFDPSSGFYITRQLVVILVGWALLGLLPFFPLNMANGAHLGGLIVGVAWGYLAANVFRSGP